MTQPTLPRITSATKSIKPTLIATGLSTGTQQVLEVTQVDQESLTEQLGLPGADSVTRGMPRITSATELQPGLKATGLISTGTQQMLEVTPGNHKRSQDPWLEKIAQEMLATI